MTSGGCFGGGGGGGERQDRTRQDKTGLEGQLLLDTDQVLGWKEEVRAGSRQVGG